MNARGSIFMQVKCSKSVTTATDVLQIRPLVPYMEAKLFRYAIREGEGSVKPWYKVQEPTAIF